MDIVIPTLWLCSSFPETLVSYLQFDSVGRIIVIDNRPSARPRRISHLTGNNKMRLIAQVSNIYVNAAWNLGIHMLPDKHGLTAILNDDIAIPEQLIRVLQTRRWQDREVIGLLNKEAIDGLYELDYVKTKSIGQQYPSFGSMLVFDRYWYKPIPSELRIWYGDDWILKNSSKVYGLKDNNIVVNRHISMNQMKKTEAFRRVLEEDKRYAQEILGFTQ